MTKKKVTKKELQLKLNELKSQYQKLESTCRMQSYEYHVLTQKCKEIEASRLDYEGKYTYAISRILKLIKSLDEDINNINHAFWIVTGHDAGKMMMPDNDNATPLERVIWFMTDSIKCRRSELQTARDFLSQGEDKHEPI